MPSLRKKLEIAAPFQGLWSGNNSKNPIWCNKFNNILLDKGGVPNKRPGFYKDDQTPAAVGAVQIDGMYLYTKQGTSGSPTTKTMYHAGGSIFAVPNDAYLESATAIKTGMTVKKTVDHAVLSDKCYCANGSQVLQVYDGSTIANITTPPASGLTGTFMPSIIEVHRWSLWAAGVPGNPCRLFKSVPQDGTDFDTNLATFDVADGYPLVGAAQIDVRPDDGTKITELVGDHFGQLIVFKENSIHRIMGATKADFCLPPEGVIDGIGAIRGSVVRANNDIYFASKKGIHRFSTVQQYGDNKESYASYPIQEYYDGLDKFSITSWCQSAHWPEKNIIVWAFPLAGSGNNNILLVYNYAVGEAGAWSVWTGLNVSSMGIFKYDGANTLYIGDTTGRIGRCNQWGRDDFGAAYTAEIEFTLDGGPNWSNWRDLLIQFNPIGGTIDLKSRVDEEDWKDKDTIFPNPGTSTLDSFTLGTSVLADDSQIDTKRLAVDQSGRVLRVNIANGIAGESMALLSTTIELMPRNSAGIHLQSYGNLTVDTLQIEGALLFGADDTDRSWRYEGDADGIGVDRYDTDEWIEKAHHS